MEQMKVTLQTLSPVVLTVSDHSSLLTASREYFSGAVLRGVFAKRYIKAKGITDKAHETEEFRKLFFEDLRFVAAYPSIGGERSVPLPLSLLKDKSGKKYLSLLTKEAEPGYKPVKGFGLVKDGTLYLPEIYKKIELHMGRGSAQERISGKSELGSIYNYEAIAEGQTFVGYIYGDKEPLLQLKRICTDAEDGFTCLVGRSRFVQYGKCSIHMGGIGPVSFTGGEQLGVVDKSGFANIYIRMDTPYIPHSVCLSNEQALNEIITAINEQMGTGKAELATGKDQLPKLFAREETVNNFVGTWNMKRPRETSVAAGSIFVLKKNGGWSKEELSRLQNLLYNGFGRRREEGFGQLRIWLDERINKASVITACIEDSFSDNAITVMDADVRAKAFNIIKNYISEKTKLCAFEDAEKIEQRGADITDINNIGFSASFFGNLEALLDDCENLGEKKNGFLAALEKRIEQQSGLRERLKQISLYDCNLLEWLRSQELMPHNANQTPRERLGTDDSFDSLIKEIGAAPEEVTTAVFYDYWRWFFRHGRKQL